MKLLLRINYLINRVVRFFLLFKANSFTKKKYPEINFSYGQFKINGQISAGRQPIKGYDLWKLLIKYKPSNIVELGSGTTSAIFSLYSKKFIAKYIAFESFDSWREVTINSISNISGFNENILFVPSQVNNNSSATLFTKIIPSDVELLYIDGPPCTLENGSKVPNYDIILAFDKGILPKIIVVDGRHETIDLILKHDYIIKYDFYPSFSYSVDNNLFFDGLYCREHSFFVRK